MAFSIAKDTYNTQTERGIIYDSLTVKVGDVINVRADGFLSNADAVTAGDVYVLGVVQGFCTNSGGVYPTGGQDPLNTPNYVTVSASNSTVAKINAVFTPIHAEQVWLADFNNARTTTNAASGYNWEFFNLLDCRTVQETSYVSPLTGGCQVVVVENGPDGNATTQAYVRFAKAFYKNR